MNKNLTVNGHEIVTDPAEAVRLLENDNLVGFDTETTGLSPWRNNLALMQFYGDTTGTLAVIQTPDGVVPEPIVDLFNDPKRTFIGHNAVSFDIPFLSTHGVPWMTPTWYDTLVGETVVTTAGRRNVSVSLKNSVRRRLGLEINKKIEHSSWANPNLTPEQLNYAAMDVISLPALMRSQQDKAKDTKQTTALEMEMQLLPCVSLMTINGLPMVPEHVRQYVDNQRVTMEEKRDRLIPVLGHINLNSPLQLKKAMERVSGYKVASTAAEYLYDLAVDPKTPEILVDLAIAILEYRGPAQRVKMYSEEWIARHIIVNRVHAKFWQCGTNTSRFSSSEPNLQQVPKDGRIIVGNIDGLQIVSVDYSQIEVRIAAGVANDEVLIARLRSDDVHRAIGAELYKVSEAEVTKDQRRHAKACSFALLFDGTGNTIYRHSKYSGGSLTIDECYDLERRFFLTFTGLAKMRHKAHQAVERNGPVFIRLPNGLVRMLVGREKTASRVLNTMVQGSAAVGIKYGILEAHRRGLVNGYLGAQVHDELVAAVPTAEAEEYGKELADAMIVGMQKVTRVPVTAEIKIGDHWME